MQLNTLFINYFHYFYVKDSLINIFMVVGLLMRWSFTERLLQYCSIRAVMQHQCEAGLRRGNNLLKAEIWSHLPRIEWENGDGMFWMCSLPLDSLQTPLFTKGPDTCRIGNLSSLSLSSEPIKISPCIIWVHLGGWRFLEGNMSGKLSGGNCLLGTGELASVPCHWEVLWETLAELYFCRKRGI